MTRAMIATTDPLTAARAAALFVSDLSAGEQPTRTEVEAAIKQALRAHGGTRGCTADMAVTYGDYPELATPRTRWARRVIENLYQRPLRPGAQTVTRRVDPHRTLTPQGVALAAWDTAASSGRPGRRPPTPAPTRRSRGSAGRGQLQQPGRRDQRERAGADTGTLRPPR